MSQFIERNFNQIQTVNGTIAAIGLEKVGQKVAGNLVTPAVWALNYAAKDITPGEIDLAIYGSSFINGPAGIIMSLLKAVIDDDIGKKVTVIREKQDPQYRNYIFPVQNYSLSAPFIAAQNIARDGGTAWKDPNGQWVFITDSRGVLVPDYEPKDAIDIMKPIYPFSEKNGKFDFCRRTCR